MCGIYGSLVSERNISDYNTNKIINSLRHRGPDQEGLWSNNEKSVLLAHTRLSILDLSLKGCQPMCSRSGRYILVYNGEIYNHQNLRNQISLVFKEIAWRGSSDTETLLELFELNGIEKTLHQLEGMFSFGVWDCKNKELTLARDRVGEKPLYYGWIGKNFVFASELKSIKESPNFSKEISTKALNYYFAFSYIKAPYSIYKNIYKLPAGSILTIKENEIYNPHDPDFKLEENNNFSLKSWYSTYDSYKKNKFNPNLNSEKKNINTLEEMISNSVSSQMISDVPIGSFLSGGIDSSLITALMQKHSKNKVKTFTIGYEDSNYDESLSAKKISNYLGTDHTELMLRPKDAFNAILKMHNIYDEPFSDSSQIPTYLVSKLASTKVKVALSGDGGDELFGGYNRYLWISSVWKKISLLPFSTRKILGSALISTPEFFWNGLEKVFKLGFFNMNIAMLDSKVKKLASRLRYVKSFEDLYFSLVVEFRPEDNILLKSQNINLNFEKDLNFLELNNIEKMMAEDKRTYLTDDIMCKVDRASMANSLETRAPFLNPDIINFASHLPLEQKIKGNKGKINLRNILNKYVPEQMFERPKMGFGLPIDSWLKNDLKDWVFDTLNEKKIINQKILNFETVDRILKEHYGQKRNWGHKIWSILMFQTWMDNQ